MILIWLSRRILQRFHLPLGLDTGGDKADQVKIQVSQCLSRSSQYTSGDLSLWVCHGDDIHGCLHRLEVLPLNK